MNLPLVKQLLTHRLLSGVGPGAAGGLSSAKFSEWLQRMSVSRFKWQANLGLKRLGWPGVTGLCLMAFGLAFYLSTIGPSAVQIERMRHETASLQERIKHAANSFTDNPGSPAGQLTAFYGFFPAVDSSPYWLRKIYHAAQSQGLALEQGDYRITEQKEGRLFHYQITLPVKGPYLQIRKFIAAVMADIPVVSLDHVSFEKQKISDPMVETKIRFTLYLRRGA